MFGLDHILSPVPVDEFLSGYKGERALHIPGTADKFPDFFDWEQVNDQINFSRPSRESIRLIYEKQPLEGRHLAKLAEWMVKGATLVINSVQQIDPIVSRFSTSLGRDLNAGINVNCYASYPSKQGFDCHYDGHVVFVIQTSGGKSWKVFEPTRMFPLDIDTIPKGEPPEADPYLECEMHVGDVLYIPRGHWHYAVATEPSVHLTVSYNQRSGIDFLLWLAEQLRNNDEFLRRDFPVAGIELLGGRAHHFNRIEGKRAIFRVWRHFLIEVGVVDDILRQRRREIEVVRHAGSHENLRDHGNKTGAGHELIVGSRKVEGPVERVIGSISLIRGIRRETRILRKQRGCTDAA